VSSPAPRRGIAQGDYLAADSPERLALRVGRLLAGVRQAAQTARRPSGALLNDLADAPPITVDQLGEFLDRRVAAAPTVGRWSCVRCPGPAAGAPTS
jgi:hypothetical protein